jgi:hypothetical protein
MKTTINPLAISTGKYRPDVVGVAPLGRIFLSLIFDPALYPGGSSLFVVIIDGQRGIK